MPPLIRLIITKSSYFVCFCLSCFLFISCCKSHRPGELQLCRVPPPQPDETFAAVVDPKEVIFMMHAIQTVYNQIPDLAGYSKLETINSLAFSNEEQQYIDSRMLVDIERSNGNPWAYVYQNNMDPNDLLIAIRGTESIMEWIKDFEINKVPFVSFTGQKKDVKVENGFFSIYKAIRTELFAILQQYKPSRLKISGHSLGGALATLLAYDIALSAPEIKPILFTYGTPRTGDQNFVNAIKQINSKDAAKLTFVVNIKDIVPKLPPTLFGYESIPFSNYQLCFDTGNTIRNHILYELALRKLFNQSLWNKAL
jgi:hypothetical protein